MRQLAALFALLLAAPAGATVQVLISSSGSGAPSTSATNYGAFPIYVWGATENTTESMVAANGAMANLRVVLATAPGTAGSGKKWVFTINKNESPTAITCEILDTAKTCQDTTHVVTFSAGDRVDISVTPTGTPTAANPRMSILWQPTTTDETIWPSSTGTNTENTTTHFFVASAGGSGATETSFESVAPIAGTAKNLYAWCSANVAAASTRVFTFRLNEAGKTLACTMSAGQSTCNDTNGAHNVTIAAGDTVDYAYSATGTPGAAGCAMGVVFVPSTTTQFAWMTNTGTATFPTTTTDKFACIQGGGNNAQLSTTEGELIQQAAQASTVKTMQFREPAGVNGGTLKITLRDSGDTALTCSSVGAQTCSATTDVTVNDDDLLSTGAHHTGTAGTARAGEISYGAVFTGSFPTTTSTTSSTTSSSTTSSSTTSSSTTSSSTTTTTPHSTATQGLPVFFGGCETGTAGATWEAPSNVAISYAGTAQCESNYAHTGTYAFSVGNAASGPTSSAAYACYTFRNGATYTKLFSRIWGLFAYHCNSGARLNQICTTNDTNGTTGCGAGASCGGGGCCVPAVTAGQTEPFYSIGSGGTQEYELRIEEGFGAGRVSLYWRTSLVFGPMTAFFAQLDGATGWHSFGFGIDTSTSPDTYELWQDGSLVASGSTGHDAGGAIDQVCIGRRNDRNSSSTLFWVDDWWQSTHGFGGWAGGTIARQGTGAIGPTDNDFSCSSCTCQPTGGTCAPSCGSNTACCNLSQTPEESATNKCSGTGNNQAQKQGIALAKFSASQSGHAGTLGANDVVNGFRATCSVSMGSDGAAGIYTRLRDNNLNLIANNPFSQLGVGPDPGYNSSPRPIGECCYDLGSQVLDFMQYGIATNTGKTVTIGDCWGMIDYTPAQAATAGNRTYSE